MTAVAVVVAALAGCTGSGVGSSAAPERTSATGPARAAAPPTTEPAPTGGAAASVSVTPSDPAADAPLTRAQWRTRLLAVSTGFNVARARCFADPVACVPVFDSTLGTHLSGAAQADVRANLGAEAARGVRTRGIDPKAMYFHRLQVYDQDPVDAMISLCVVDKGVRYIPANATKPKKIVDGRKATYFVIYHVEAGADGVLRISDIENTPYVLLRSRFGQCRRYVD